MKVKILFVIMLAGIMIMSGAAVCAGGDCFFKGIPLKAKVKFVDDNPDIRIKFVRDYPGIRIDFVDQTPYKCGQWRIVKYQPDFTIKIVKSFPDIRVLTGSSSPKAIIKGASRDCYFKGIPLKGNVGFVGKADFSIQYVSSFPDIRVKFITGTAIRCGEWSTDGFPDFRVNVVEAFADIKVQVVDAFPGVR